MERKRTDMNDKESAEIRYFLRTRTNQSAVWQKAIHLDTGAPAFLNSALLG